MMIETIVLDYLSSVLPEPCSLEVPERPPARFVVLEKTGSSRKNFMDTAIFAVQSYGPSLFEAAELNERVIAAMDDLILLPDIFSSKLDSDYNFTDTATKKYRYQAVYNITY